MQHRDVAALGDETWQSGRKLAGDFISIVPVWEAPKHTSSGAGQSGRCEFVQPHQCVTNFGVTLLDHWLTVVTTAPLKKAAKINGRRIPCQLGIGENFCCADKDLRYGDEEPRLLQGDRLQALADAFGEGRATAYEHRHVGTQCQPQLGQALFAEVRAPEVIEAEEGGGTG